MTELLHLSLPVPLARAPRPSTVTPHTFLGGGEGRDWVLGSALGPGMAGKPPPGPSRWRCLQGSARRPGNSRELLALDGVGQEVEQVLSNIRPDLSGS